MNVVRQLEEKRWREFVDSHEQGNIFHTPDMFDVFSRAKGYRPTLWAVVSDDERILALLLPVQITVLGQLLRRLSTRSVVFGSVLDVNGEEGAEALKLLLQTYVRQANGESLFTELRNLSDMDSDQPTLRENGFGYEDHLNFLINLARSPEQILNSIGPRTRKVIRRGLRAANVVVEEITEIQDVGACYDLLKKTYDTANVPLADPSLFRAAFELLHPRGMIRFTLARIGTTPVATSVELLYKGTMYGWYGGVDRSYGEYAPNEILTWHILEWGAQNGYEVYDFGGAGKPNENYGVRDFKAKFGGDLVNFGRNIYVHGPKLLKLSQVGYQLLRRFL